MKTYCIQNTEEKKKLLARLNELTGTTGQYTWVPRRAYLYEHCSFEKDGTLRVEDGLNPKIIKTLLAEGLIREYNPEEKPNPAKRKQRTKPKTDRLSKSKEPIKQAKEEKVEPDLEDETDAHHDLNEKELIKPNIAFPLEKHSGESLQNLISLLYSRGDLISKSTGGTFGADEQLIETMKRTADIPTMDTVLALIEENRSEGGKGLCGIEITENRLIFTGFPATDDQEVITAFLNLASLMNNQSITQKRIHTKKVKAENEKYSMRTWLIRIGMNGMEYKKSRDILMRRLSGHTAFRTERQADLWKEKQKAVRAQRRNCRCPKTIVPAETPLPTGAGN